MAETRININELKGEDGDLIKELTTFLKEKTKVEVEAETDDLVVKGEEARVSRTYLRVLLRKFLHKKELKDSFRVIGGSENTLIVKGKRVYEKEE
ncbi:MAG TPA: 60S ribosomal protein L22 [Candidatus Acidoferrales bacterium]|nr:60S ribosomal protein L22 [Candidatus Acidoferrales bacterium]